MKQSNTKKQDTFKIQLEKFKSLVVGAKMAKLSSIVLITVSLVLAYKSRENITIVLSLLIGALGLVFFTHQFLSLKDIKQKSYTQTSLVSSISKLKSYMSNRKKYEMYFMSFWAITLIPYAAKDMESIFLGIIVVLSAIVLVGFLGNLAFKKVDTEIALLETIMEKELQLQ